MSETQLGGMVPDGCAPSGTSGRKVWAGRHRLLSGFAASNNASDGCGATGGYLHPDAS